MAVRQPDDRSDAARGGQILKRDRSPRVLCATDLLNRSDRAVSRADAIARELGAQLLLLHVVDTTGSALDTRRRDARARSILNAQARKLARSGNGAHVSVRAGRPQQIIADVAIKWDADLIVLGPYRRRFGDSFRGTTAERVIRIADRPVLVVNRDSSDPYAQVLLAADRSRMSIGITHVTKELGLLEGARASVVHALQHTRGATPYRAGLSESEVRKYQQSLREWLPMRSRRCSRVLDSIQRASRFFRRRTHRSERSSRLQAASALIWWWSELADSPCSSACSSAVFRMKSCAGSSTTCW